MTSACEFARRVAECWSSATASTYTPANAALGQCSVTALLAQEVLGGAILKTLVGSAWHFYNRVDGCRLDFTAAQFAGAINYDDVASSRADAFTDATLEQLARLRQAYVRPNSP